MTEHLKVGMWLGTENRVKKLTYVKRGNGAQGPTGWRLVDSTCEVYHQRDLPDGMKATTHKEPNVNARPRVPWPPTPKETPS